MPQYFLAKTDPQTYSIEDFQQDKTTLWDGVHNAQAIKVIQSWNLGDLVLIYHSQGEALIVGLAKVVSQPKENLDDLRYSWAADLELVREFPPEQKVSLKEVKASGLFDNFALVKQSRLSTMLCPPEFIEWLRQKGLSLDIYHFH